MELCSQPKQMCRGASGVLTFIVKELREVVAPTLFFAIGFNLIVLITQLILADYFLHFANFMVLTTAGANCTQNKFYPTFIGVEAQTARTGFGRWSTEARSLDELWDRNASAHQEMIDLITKLAARKEHGQRR